MAYEIPGQRISVRWGTTTPATTSDQFLMYVLDSNGYAVISATTSFTRPFGILQDVPTSTAAPGSYMINGVSKVKAAASTLAKGDMFACSSAGLAASSACSAASMSCSDMRQLDRYSYMLVGETGRFIFALISLTNSMLSISASRMFRSESLCT